jgi:hypothetical protein
MGQFHRPIITLKAPSSFPRRCANRIIGFSLETPELVSSPVHAVTMPSSKTPLEVNDITITSSTVTDIRFPTSLDGVGSDAMHVGTNGSHPYIQLHTDHGDLIGEGIVSPVAVNTSRVNANGKIGFQQRSRK